MKRKKIPKESTNLTFTQRIRAIASGYCDANEISLSQYAEDLMRDDLRKKGYPVDASPEEVAKFIAEALKAESSPESGKSSNIKRRRRSGM